MLVVDLVADAQGVGQIAGYRTHHLVGIVVGR